VKTILNKEIMKHWRYTILFWALYFNAKGQFKIIPNPLGSQKAADSRIINSLGVTNDGILLVATNWNDASSHNLTPPIGFYIYSEGRWITKKIDQKSDAFEEYFNLTVSPDSRKVVLNSQTVSTGTYRKIVLLESLGQSNLKEIPINAQQVGLYSHIAFDSNSNLWCSVEAGQMVDNKGNITLAKYSDNRWKYFTTTNCFSMIHFIFTKNDQIITNNGSNFLREFDETTVANKQKIITNKLKYNSKNVIYKDGAIWYENEYDKSIIKILNDTETKYTLPSEVENINCMIVTNNNKLLVGSPND
jgi:hypothetical protein